MTSVFVWTLHDILGVIAFVLFGLGFAVLFLVEQFQGWMKRRQR